MKLIVLVQKGVENDRAMSCDFFELFLKAHNTDEQDSTCLLA